MRYIKYLSEDSGLKFLEKGALKYTPLNNFNDPFEGYFLLCMDKQDKENSQYPIDVNIDVDNKSVVLKEYLISAHSVNDETHFLDSDSILDYLCGKEGIACLCLSKSKIGIPDNMLMWSHYSRDHKGIAIAFDVNHPYFKNIDHVHYGSERLILDHKIISDHAESLPVNTFFAKDECWKYENEVRLSKWQKDLTVMNTKEDDSIILLDSIPLDAIKEIFIGCKASPEMAQKTYNFCRENSIEYFHLKKNILSYSLSSDISKQKIDHLSLQEKIDLHVRHTFM